MAIMTRLFVSLLVFLLSACSTPPKDEVIEMLDRRLDNDGKTVTVTGILGVYRIYYNLYSKDGQRCIGLLLSDDQRVEYKSSVGKRVTLTGTLEAEGCGRDGICMDSLCSPTIMTHVTKS